MHGGPRCCRPAEAAGGGERDPDFRINPLPTAAAGPVHGRHGIDTGCECGRGGTSPAGGPNRLGPNRWPFCPMRPGSEGVWTVRGHLW